jgi:hypothetical protein
MNDIYICILSSYRHRHLENPYEWQEILNPSESRGGTDEQPCHLTA